MNYSWKEEDKAMHTGRGYTLYKPSTKKGELDFHVTVNVQDFSNEKSGKRDHISFEKNNTKIYFFFENGTWYPKDIKNETMKLTDKEREYWTNVLSDMKELGIKINGIKIV